MKEFKMQVLVSNFGLMDLKALGFLVYRIIHIEVCLQILGGSCQEFKGIEVPSQLLEIQSPR